MAEDQTELAEQGESFREDLRWVLEKSGLDLGALANQGCLCCDVGKGPEIPALIAFHPQPFIVGEGTEDFEGRQQNDAELQTLVEKAGCRLVRQDPLETLKELAERKIKLGLITWLNILPEKADYDYVLEFLRLAQPLLKPGGAAVLSVVTGGIDGDDCDGGYRFIVAGAHAEEFGYKINFPDSLDSPHQSVGQAFIVAVNSPAVS